MDVCNRHVNDISFNEENLLGMQVKLDWKKIGEVHSNSRRQCLIVCMVCETFDSAYTTNDASAFWDHVQTQHLDYPLFKDDKPLQDTVEVRSCVDGTNTDNNIGIAESMKTSSIANPNNSKSSPEKNHLEPNNDQKQREADIHVSDTRLPDTQTIDSNTRDYQVVAISDDEDVPNDYQIQHNQGSDQNVAAIELSDDEVEFVPTEEIESTFATRLKELYSCELCGELFIDQETLKEHKTGHNDVSVNDDVPRSRFQHFPEASTATEPYLNTGVMQNYRCRFCRLQFSTLELLEEHQSTHAAKSGCQEENSLIPLQCKACAEHFNSLTLLTIHERNVHKIGLYEELKTCAQCLNVMAKSDFEIHISMCHHRNISPSNSTALPVTRAYKCSICGIRTTTEESMAIHHQRYHSSTSHPETTKCTICNKVLSVKTIHIHMRSVHGDVEKVKCPFCGRWFKYREKYEIHLEQVHSTNPVPLNQIASDSLSSSSLTSQPEVLTEKHSEISPSQYEEIYDDEIISYGELIPMDCTQSNA